MSALAIAAGIFAHIIVVAAWFSDESDGGTALVFFGALFGAIWFWVSAIMWWFQ